MAGRGGEMSALNWRCCAKHLKRYKKDIEILVKNHEDDVFMGWYEARGKVLRVASYGETYFIKLEHLKYHTFVTLGEL